MENESKKIEDFFENNRYTLDLADLSDDERRESSILIGGSGVEFLTLKDRIEYQKVGTVVFKWGDEKIKDTLANMFEHREEPNPTILPFNLTAIVDRWAWHLVLQRKDFEPEINYRDQSQYVILPFNQEDANMKIEETIAMQVPRPQMLGKIGNRYYLFEMAVRIDEG